MAFGVKLKNITTAQEYTLESFYEAIKDKQFTAGTPSLVKHGPATIIAFPALDKQNQVQIIKGSFSASSKKWSIQKAEEAGLGNLAANMALDSVTGGIFGWGKIVGTNAKKCEQLVDATAEELKALDL